MDLLNLRNNKCTLQLDEHSKNDMELGELQVNTIWLLSRVRP